MTPHVKRLREEGRCTRCGELNLRTPKWLCALCVTMALAYRRALWARRRLANICTRCGHAPAARFDLCLGCREKHAAARRAA